MTAVDRLASEDRTRTRRLLMMLRAMAVAFVLLDLAMTLVASTGPRAMTAAVLSASVALVGVAHPRLGALLTILPVSSVAIVGENGQAYTPLVISVMGVALTQSRPALLRVTAGLAAVIATVFALGSPDSAPGTLFALVATAGVGLLVRRLWERSRFAVGEISTMARAITEIRRDERLALAHELLDIVERELASNGQRLREASSSTGRQALPHLLTTLTAGSRAALSRLRTLVSTLRQETSDVIALQDVLYAAEEGLVELGHAVEFEAPSEECELPGPQAEALSNCLAVASDHVQLAGPPGVDVALTADLLAGEARAALTAPVSSRLPAERLASLTSIVDAVSGRVSERMVGGEWQLAITLPRRDPTSAPPGRPGLAETLLRLGPDVISTTILWGAIAGACWAAALLAREWSTGHPLALQALWVVTFTGVAVATRAPNAGTALLVAGMVADAALNLDAGPFPHPMQVVSLCLAVLAPGRPRGVVACVAVAWLGWLARRFQGEQDPGIALGAIGFVLFGLALGVASRFFLQLRAEQLSTLDRLRLERAEARTSERVRLAGELHDVVAYQLSLLNLRASGLTDAVDDAELASGLDALAAINEDAQRDLTTLVGLMRDGWDTRATGAQDPSGSDGAWLSPSATVEAMAKVLADAGFTPYLVVGPGVDDCDATTARTLRRMLREGTTNILRYAPPASPCRLILEGSAHELSLSLESELDTRFRHASEATGNGLRGLAERTVLTGGTFKAGPIGHHWQLAAVLPR